MPWATAKVNGVVIAETDFPQLVGGDVYFPPECIRWEYLERSTPTTPTSIVERLRKPNETPLLHYTLNVNGTVLPDAAWSHQDPKCGKLEVVRSHVAFKGMAPVMLMYKKNFKHVSKSAGSSSEDGGSQSSRSGSNSPNTTPNTSTPTTPTFGFSVPVIQLPSAYNPSIYEYNNSSSGRSMGHSGHGHYNPPPLTIGHSMGPLGKMHCGGGAGHGGWRERMMMLPSVPEVEGGLLEIMDEW